MSRPKDLELVGLTAEPAEIVVGNPQDHILYPDDDEGDAFEETMSSRYSMPTPQGRCSDRASVRSVALSDVSLGDEVPRVLGSARRHSSMDLEDVDVTTPRDELVGIAAQPAEFPHANGALKVDNVAEKKLASNTRTFVNALICFIGSGVLGLPFAVKKVGVAGAVMVMCFVAGTSLHCMFLVADLKVFLTEERKKLIKTYGDIGYYAMGRLGSVLVDSFIVLTQTGFCIAYLIFISQTLHDLANQIGRGQLVMACVPLLVCASWLRHMKYFAPFSVVAEIANFAALISVYVFDFRILGGYSGAVPPVAEVHTVIPSGIAFFFGVAVYCFEGIGMVLPIRNSMQKPEDFKKIWGAAMGIVTVLYLSFGLVGYLAFRDTTDEIITRNLPPNGVSVLVKVSLCVGLYFTYPIMLFPVFELMEEFMQCSTDTNFVEIKRNVFRSLFVAFTAFISWVIPNFGIFISLIGATASAALAFVLPSVFYLILRRADMSWFQITREVVCISVGVVGGVLGTMNAIWDVMEVMRGEVPDIPTEEFIPIDLAMTTTPLSVH
mmetsp:Transcript_15290/g.33115  ORF Transcript_15290/g.33115 Transcript_15290/m.33115 type:complete len:550 (-) Transcript_15290:601-2250(-)